MTHEFERCTAGFPQELKLMLSMLNGDFRKLSSEEGRERLQGVDWNLFLQLAMHHRLYAVLYLNITAMHDVPFPPAVVESLKQEYTANTFRMLHLTAEMERVCGRLTQAGIRNITMKGPALAHDLYGDVSLRTSKDLDLLIPFDDVEQAEAVLLDLGYICKDDKGRRSVSSWKWREHHICYKHPVRKTQVEIHWRLNPDTGREAGFETLWQRSRISAYTSTPVRMLEREDLFAYLVTHGARHGWFRLRWLYDIDRMLRTMPLDLDAASRRMKLEGRLPIAGQALILSAALFNTPLQRCQGELQSSMEGKGERLARQALLFMQGMLAAPDDLKIYRSYLFALRSPGQKLLFFKERLYPSTWDVAQLPLPKSLHFLYFPLRPFLWCWRRMKRSTMTERG
ncbi:nucleotidyltransferase family protein [Paenibacillus sp. JJ-223]|uniref:nucleotidyltransferase domain-containing protein n=1 Tax=Paenibacillus sp. JJ-223 TaxID=2905647 RepID=UPI001F2383C6|nr:nucleotidyltransferase family protein [Paenibacillus sp. JJ-223]CAH1206589.1 hypothetical protein PAECIP111890_02769 [Paenibacillus sp. JJ-223]